MKKTVISLIILCVCSFQSQLFAAESDTGYLFFEHWRHYDSQGIACSFCHKGPDKGVYAQPGHSICEDCHPAGKKNDYESAKGDNCGKCHPNDTTYSTKILSKIDRSSRSFYHTDQTHPLCDVCHGPMLEDKVSLGQLILSQGARDIVRRKAHRFHFADDCKACHNDNRNAASKPKNHNSGWLKTGHLEVAPEFRCRICHTKSYCKNCHEYTY